MVETITALIANIYIGDDLFKTGVTYAAMFFAGFIVCFAVENITCVYQLACVRTVLGIFAAGSMIITHIYSLCVHFNILSLILFIGLLITIIAIPYIYQKGMRELHRI